MEGEDDLVIILKIKEIMEKLMRLIFEYTVNALQSERSWKIPDFFIVLIHKCLLNNCPMKDTILGTGQR